MVINLYLIFILDSTVGLLEGYVVFTEIGGFFIGVRSIVVHVLSYGTLSFQVSECSSSYSLSVLYGSEKTS